MKYNIADFIIEVIIPEHSKHDILLPSFTHFKDAQNNQTELLFNFNATYGSLLFDKENKKLLEESINEAGIIKVWDIKEGYLIEAMHESATKAHSMIADKSFNDIKAAIIWDDPYAGQILSSLIRIAFSQAILPYTGVNIHASAIKYNEKAYLFLGKSGTGKSTHAKLWLEHIENTELINDDNPIIIVKENSTKIYGTPWSGKTPCYKNIVVPLGGIVKLQQAPCNLFRSLDTASAFITLIPGCAIIKQNKVLYNHLCDTLQIIAERERIGFMQCLPNKDAAIVCKEELTKHE